MAPQSKSQNERHKVILAQLLQKEGTVSYGYYFFRDTKFLTWGFAIGIFHFELHPKIPIIRIFENFPGFGIFGIPQIRFVEKSPGFGIFSGYLKFGFLIVSEFFSNDF